MSHNSNRQSWLIIFNGMLLLCPLLGTHSTPLKRTHTHGHGHGSDGVGSGGGGGLGIGMTVAAGDGNGDGDPCAHNTIGELIKGSPIILKALGAHIFTDEDFIRGLPWLHMTNSYSYKHNNNNKHKHEHQQQQQQQQRAQQQQHNDSTASARTTTTATTATSSASSANSTTASGSAYNTLTFRASNSNSNSKSTIIGSAPMAASAAMPSSSLPTSSSSSPPLATTLLITLTPETIYKGASLLKMTPSGDSATRARYGSGGGGGNGGGANGGSGSNGGSGNGGAGSANNDAAYQYEGQLNATLQPLACFDANILKLLPTELIVFGKLLTAQQQQQQQQQQSTQTQQQQQQQHGSAQESDVLSISINGLHRWSSQFENHIWKHLGWDDWSDYTLCSVTCGKGVQQRFRRCLLDNPMMGLSSMNRNVNLNLNALEESDDIAAAAADGIDVADVDVVATTATAVAGDDDIEMENIDEIVNDIDDNAANGFDSFDELDDDVAAAASSALPVSAVGAAAAAAGVSKQEANVNVMWPTADATATIAPTDAADSRDANKTMRTVTSKQQQQQQQQQTHHKRRKHAKTVSTLFCEGYNIEQRNCNTFECSDDISDLLKFYKRLPEDFQTATSSMSSSSSYAVASMPSSSSAFSSTQMLERVADGTDTNGSTTLATSVGLNNAAAATFTTTSTSTTTTTAALTTPANMGFVRSWRNALNFTLMLTLRIKNDSKTAATIFSIRNATHNLYLESCRDGMRLYLERDNSTEMLPVKFNLFDYRWHQVAISIQNGDFISIYVDCCWTNSFVVSKRLFSLPLDADVEIGRGFNGELQQLLVLPNDQKRQQCSSRRTSINEVKRYIIDTFIDDYSN